MNSDSPLRTIKFRPLPRSRKTEHMRPLKTIHVPPPRRDEIYLNLDIGQSGLGDMSYRPLDPYRYFPRPEKFVLRIGAAVLR